VEPAPELEADLFQQAREASQIPLPAGDSSSATSKSGSAADRLGELELEQKRAEREERQAAQKAEERKAAREAEEKKAARETQRLVLEAEEKREQRAMKAEERRRKLEATVAREQAERDARLKAEQLKLKREIRLIELKARQVKPGDGKEVDGQTPSDPSGASKLALQTKRFGEMMRHVLPKMPQESAKLLQFFETVKKLYALYEVPSEVQAKILISLLPAQGKSLVNQMSIDDMSKYDELKEFLLTKYKLTSREYKIRFETAVKHADETYILFAARLRNLLSYYLKSRLVEDYNTLVELLISDRLKGSLPQGLLNYILTQEGKGWYVASKVASLADVYVNNRVTMIGQKASEGKPVKVAIVTSYGTSGGQNHHVARGQSQAGSSDGQGGQQSPTQARRWQCYNCGEFGHMSRDCPQERADARNGPPSPSKLGGIKYHNCSEWGHMARDCASEPSGRRGGAKGSWRGRYRGGPRGDKQNGGVRVNLASTGRVTQVKTREMGVQYGDGGEQANPRSSNSWEFGDHPIVGTVCA